MKISDRRRVDMASPVTTRQNLLRSMAASMTSYSPNWSEPPNSLSLQATATSLPESLSASQTLSLRHSASGPACLPAHACRLDELVCTGPSGLARKPDQGLT